LNDCSDRGEHIKELPTSAFLVSVNASRHAENTQEVLWIEGEMKSDGKYPEVPKAEAGIEQAAGRFGEPIIKAGENPENDSPYDDVVKVSDNEIRIVELPIKRRAAQHYPREPCDEKLEKKSDAEQHRDLHPYFAAVHRT